MRLLCTAVLLVLALPAHAQFYTDPEIIVFAGATHTEHLEAAAYDPETGATAIESQGVLGTSFLFDVQYSGLNIADFVDLGLGFSLDFTKELLNESEKRSDPNYTEGAAGWASLYGFGRFTLPSLRKWAVTPYLHGRVGWNAFIGDNGTIVIMDQQHYESTMSAGDLFYGGGLGITVGRVWFAEAMLTRYQADATNMHRVASVAWERYPADMWANAFSFRVGVNILEALDL